jgi:acetylornithine deacetylase/succinyl-diaminopimelate desuccinylase-like protein
MRVGWGLPTKLADAITKELARPRGPLVPRAVLCAILVASAFAETTPARAEPLTAQQQMALDVFRELVEINTVTARGDTAQAAEAMGRRLRSAGLPETDVQVFLPAPHKGNLVARLRGTGKRRPLLLLAHLDVVEAKREDWSVDPFKLVEQDGYFYGRGTSDDKFMAAAFVANLIRYQQEGYRPDRDVVIALETDEEILDRNVLGIQWLLNNHRELIDAEFALNEGGGVALRAGRPLRNSVQTSEKVAVSFRLEATDRGGHSSLPTRDNPIYRLAEGLVRLSKFQFPITLNETTRAYFARMANLEDEQTAAEMRSLTMTQADLQALPIARLSASPLYNAQMRTTCVATMLEGGHAANALPQVARATINCRVMPGISIAEVQSTLERVLDNAQIAVTQLRQPVLSAPSELRQDVMQAIEKVTAEMWPGVPVIPTMGTGATDSSYLRNAGIPTFGTSGLAIEDVRAHGKDERVPVKSFFDGQEYLYRLIKILAGGS